jgi:hypothetical protein
VILSLPQSDPVPELSYLQQDERLVLLELLNLWLPLRLLLCTTYIVLGCLSGCNIVYVFSTRQFSQTLCHVGPSSADGWVLLLAPFPQHVKIWSSHLPPRLLL